MKKTQFLFSIITLFSTILFAQNQPNNFLQKNKELIVTIGPSATRLINSNVDKDEFKVVDKQNGANFSFSYNKYFKKYFNNKYFKKKLL